MPFKITFIFLLLLFPLSAAAQLEAQSTEGKIFVAADNGIEWDRSNNVYTATGNAQAQRGEDFFVSADVLSAYYGLSDPESQKIEYIEARGNAFTRNSGNILKAEKISYDLEQKIIVGRGESPVFQSRDGLKVRAKKRMTFNQTEKRAVIEGDALVIDPQYRMQADIMEILFNSGAREEDLGKAREVIADGNVSITSETATATANSLRYDFKARFVQLYGNVKILQNGNQIAGEYAEYPLEGGVARVTATRPGSNDRGDKQRVFGWIKPSETEQ